MIPLRRPRVCCAALIVAACACAAFPATASAFNPLKPVCGVIGLISGIAGKACGAVSNAGRFVKAGKKLVTGHVGSAVKTALGSGGSPGGSSAASTALGLAAIGTWVLGGAKFALHETANVLGQTTSPQLGTTWFSSAYWRMSGISLVLTLPFLFAAAVQALLRSDLALLARAALGYLPLAMLAVTVAAPLTMLLLAASDQMSAVVSSASSNSGAHFLDSASLAIGGLTLITGSPFLAFLVGVFIVAGALVLWLELLMREAAVYVIVLMLPLAFAALVWPARRVWAIRAVELLVALILSKFAIVAVLSLGGAALGHAGLHSITGMLAGFVLVVMGAFAPWAVLRLLPLSELASGAVGSLRGEVTALAGPQFARADAQALDTEEWATSTTAQMRHDADEVPESDSVAANVRSRPARKAAGAQAESLAASGKDNSRSSDLEEDASAVGSDGVEAADAAAGSDREERLPGMEPMWQAEDLTWKPLTLGADEGWPPQVWPAEETESPAAGGEIPDPAGDEAEAPGPAADGGPRDIPSTAEDHDPTPGPQDPQSGRL